MELKELSEHLDTVISAYQNEAGKACQYCSDLSIGDALSASHNATAKALTLFKAEILTYLSQHQN